MHIVTPPPQRQDFARAHSFIHPPPLEGYLQGWAVGVYKIWPPTQLSQTQFDKITSRYEYWEVSSPLSLYLDGECPYIFVTKASLKAYLKGFLAQERGVRRTSEVPNF